jgi:hypothetical protein
LIDECLDWRLARGLPGHDVASVPRLGWNGIKNGRLLAMMTEAGFEVLITGDRNLQFQQHIAAGLIAVIVLQASSTKLVDTLPLMSQVLLVLPTLKPGTVRLIG